MNTAAKCEITSAPPAVLLETRVGGVAPKNTTAIGAELSVSSTLRWGSWQVYDKTAVGRLVGLDYFGSRFFSAAQGRFTSPDKPLIGQDPRYPQSWNLYGYVGNNPIRFVDPTGHDYQICIFGGTCFTITDEQYFQLYQQQNGKQGIGLPLGVGGGVITCGGTICGIVSYFERPLRNEGVDIGISILAGKASQLVLGKAFGWVARLFGRTATTAVTSTASDLIAGKVLTGFSAAEEQMIQKALSALEAAGYNTGRLTELVRTDFGGRMAGMSLGDNGAALAGEAFESQAMLNHVLEEELLHTQQAARGLSAGAGPGAADALEAEVDAVRKFPDPRKQ